MIDKLKQRILNISKELNLSHIGSNISCLPIYVEIYKSKKPDDIVIACNAHSHLAHLVVKEAFTTASTSEEIKANRWAERMIEEHGIHCDRKAGCDASGGSLGHGLGIAIGYAISNPTHSIFVIVSEGSMMEGSSWEALRIANDMRLKNLFIYPNFNGYSAVAKIDSTDLVTKMAHYAEYVNLIYYGKTNNGEGFEGIEGHYKKL
jgi:transketolase